MALSKLPPFGTLAKSYISIPNLHGRVRLGQRQTRRNQSRSTPMPLSETDFQNEKFYIEVSARYHDYRRSALEWCLTLIRLTARYRLFGHEHQSSRTSRQMTRISSSGDATCPPPSLKRDKRELGAFGPQTFADESDRARLSAVALKAFLALMKAWDLSNAEASGSSRSFREHA